MGGFVTCFVGFTCEMRVGGLDSVGFGGGPGQDCRAGLGLCPAAVDEAGEHEGERPMSA